MPRRNKWMHLVAGLAAGLALGLFFKLCLRSSARTAAEVACPEAAPDRDPLQLIGLGYDEDVHNSNRTLVFVGVMTAERYLETRARAVAETWARDLPGRLAFFSSEGSRAAGLPLVALRGVDDGYPPQKKSFMMLLYMYERYGDRFEWFMRADDDVYVRGDRLEEFLRSVDSRKALFIGQAGRGTSAERDALGLASDENFCMGGPGVLLSRETLRRVAPHVRYCLKHLYTTHEDVELGRCVAKFAGVACTWSYDMQTILHHNGSGAAAYAGRLKRREVHRAVTLHPVKHHLHMYRLHSHFKGLRLQELRERSLQLHRDTAASLRALGAGAPAAGAGFRLPDGSSLFSAPPGDPDYLGDNTLLGAAVELDRYRPDSFDDVLIYEFVSKSVYSHTHSNPKRRIEGPLKEALDDVIREVMDIINSASRQRGRVIDFNELLYGYTRLDPLHGADHVLDLLLRYRRYRGRKLTAAVRRHAYLQQAFAGTEIRELPMGEPAPAEDPLVMEEADGGAERTRDYDEFDEAARERNGFLDFKNLNIPLKEAFENGLNRLQNLPKAFMWSDADVEEYPIRDREIKFAVPLSGRQETFARFMRNYEDIVLKSDEVASLIVVLYLDWKRPESYAASEALVAHYRRLYPRGRLELLRMGSEPFSRGAALTAAARACRGDDLLFFIDVDMMFNFETLRRVRINTIRYTQVYFPIVFSEYNPEVVNGDDYNKFAGDSAEEAEPEPAGGPAPRPTTARELVNLQYSKTIDDDLGYFRHYGFGIASVYRCDLERVGGFDLSIKGWGLEDVQLFERLLKSNLTVFRGADESLVHVFHAVECERGLGRDQYLMCLGTKASTLGSDKHMTYYMLNHPEVLWPDAASPA